MKIDSLDIVKDLIANKEGEQVEFKKTTGQLERGMETLCAFLNDAGGTVLFGVADNGEVVGQEVSDKTKREIAEAINRLEPVVSVQITYFTLPDSEKKVIAFHVEEERLNRPFCYKGRPYMRVESVTTTMPQSRYIDLLLQRDDSRYSWEHFGNTDLELQDLDNNEVLKTVRLGIECGRLPEDTGNDIPVILGKFGLLKDGVLNHAAAVLFGRHEKMEYPQCLLRLARFRGTDKSVFMDNQRLHGNIFQLLNAAMAFIFKHLSLSGTTDTLEREEHLTVPYKAIREGVLNSLAHRSYRDAGGSVGI
ncbi:MAG: putative DNA binding domain-containing protein, partial [Clostridium sp.]|nr:putative DNA binding domain-containing protein [Clostridium sp.]